MTTFWRLWRLVILAAAAGWIALTAAIAVDLVSFRADDDSDE